MTRRIRPPKHPVTGHPYVDNMLRNAWREHRDYLRGKPANQIALALNGSIVWYWKPDPKARKPRKRLRQWGYTNAFQYHPTAYYTPERIILNDPR